MPERLHFHFSLSCIGEGNGNPLQCSSLENPKDGGAWWAAVYGVAQSQTLLKWLSNSSINILHWVFTRNVFLLSNDFFHSVWVHSLLSFTAWDTQEMFWMFFFFFKSLLFFCQCCVRLFVTLWTAAHQASLSFTISWILLKLMSTELVMPSNHFILSCPLLLPSIFPSIRFFFSELALCIR